MLLHEFSPLRIFISNYLKALLITLTAKKLTVNFKDYLAFLSSKYFSSLPHEATPL